MVTYKSQQFGNIFTIEVNLIPSSLRSLIHQWKSNYMQQSSASLFSSMSTQSSNRSLTKKELWILTEKNFLQWCVAWTTPQSNKLLSTIISCKNDKLLNSTGTARCPKHSWGGRREREKRHQLEVAATVLDWSGPPWEDQFAVFTSSISAYSVLNTSFRFSSLRSNLSKNTKHIYKKLT